MKKLRLNRVILRYVASYLMAFLTPVLILHFTLYPRQQALMERQAAAQETSHLSVIAENLRRRVEQLYAYGNLFYASSDIVSYVLHDDDPVNRTRIVSEMQSGFIANDYDAVFFYNPRAGRMYTSSASYLRAWVNQTEKDKLFYPALAGDMLFERMEGAKKLDVFSGKTYLSGIPRTRTLLVMPAVGNYGAFLFIIETAKMLQFGEESDTARFLLDDSGRVLAAHSVIDGARAEDIDLSLLLGALEGDGSLAIGSANYTALETPLREFGMRLVSLTSYDRLHAGMRDIQNRYTLSMTFLAVAGILLAALFSHISYKPVRAVRKRASDAAQTMEGEMLETGRDDFGEIMRLIDSMDDEYGRITSRYKQISAQSQQYFLFRYLYDGVDSEQDALELARLYEIDMRDQVVCVAFAFQQGENGAPGREAARAALEQMRRVRQENPGAASCYIIDGAGYANAFMLLFFDQEEDLKQYYYRLYALEGGVKAGIGTYQSVSEPGKSRAMSLAALEVALSEEGMRFAGSEDVPVQETDAFRLLYDALHAMEMAIIRGDSDQVRSAFNAIMGVISTQNKRMHVVSAAYMNIYNTFARAYNMLRGERGLTAAPLEYIYSDYGVPRTMEEIKLNLETLKNQILSILESAGAGGAGASPHIQDVLRYIDENFSDSGVTLSGVAERFGFTYSNFSHYFRGRTGVTFSSYLERLRVNKSKELLRDTLMTIDQVASLVGYTNANTFTRSFKKLENVAPGSFRKGAK